jgi:hypothetical protein
MLLEITLFLIHQPPGINYNFNVTINGIGTQYSLNMIVTCLSLAKLLIVIRTVFRYSQWGKMSQ